MRSLDVAVIGCGTAGPAAAIFLARQGHRVTVYERVAELGPVGAGITLQPTGLAVLERLGLAAPILARGARIDRLSCVDARGRTVVDLRYATLDERLFGVGLHRGVLFESLYEAVRAEPGVTVRIGVDCVNLTPRRRGHGRSIVTRAGERLGAHDLVVVADGARSSFRDDTALRKRVRRYPWGALWFVHEDDELGGGSTLLQSVDGTRTLVGLLPTGRLTEAGRPMVSLFFSIAERELAAWRERPIDRWKAAVRRVCPRAEPVLDAVTDAGDLLFSAYHDVVMDRWATRDVVYLGDAAHATSPQLGQGANLALYDAMVLADAIASEPSVLACALDAYCRARRDHLAYYQWATRWLTPFFQSDHTWLGPLRDVAMPLATLVPPARWLMTASMAGIVSGFTGRHLPLRPLPP